MYREGSKPHIGNQPMQNQAIINCSTCQTNFATTWNHQPLDKCAYFSKVFFMEIREFKSLLPKGKAVMGFDYGEKRLGVAVSDLLLMTANPVTIIQRTTWDKDLAQIKKIIAKKEIGGLVYGLPLQMNGEKGETADKVQKFALKLAQEIDLPYIFWDERLSSRAVENFLISEVDMSRAKRKQKLDANAAAYILQGFLDALAYC